MATDYRMYFAYQNLADTASASGFQYFVPLHSFSVLGGAVRTIKADSTNDISVASELEQARTYKNITLFMPPAKDHLDMEVALDLTNYANKKTELLFSVHVERRSGGRQVVGLNLVDQHARIERPPSLGANRLLMIEVLLPSAIITSETFSKGHWVSTENI